MKKIISILTLLIVMMLSVFAGDETTMDVSRLPQAAQTFLNQNFKGVKVTRIEIDRENGSVQSFETRLSDATKIEFSADGNLCSIENKRSGISKKFVSPKALQYLEINYPTAKILSCEKKPYGFELEISGNIELKFNSDGNFIGRDS